MAQNLPRTEFKSDEVDEFERSFSKQFVIAQDEVYTAEEFVEAKALLRQMGEIMKHKFNNRKFGGMYASSDEFGLIPQIPDAHGYSDWYTQSITANTGGSSGSVTDWIDDGSGDNVGGSTGIDNPVEVGRPVGHLILGYESFHPSPKVRKLECKKNEVPVPIWHMHRQMMGSQRKIFKADKPIRFVPGDKYAITLWGGYDGGSDIPSLFGGLFVEGDWLREEDPYEWTGTSVEYPVVTSSTP